MKKFLALARVSSREQEREGFSLDIQEDALSGYAKQQGGSIVRMFKIAETASKSEERKTFRELIAYAKKHCFELDGLLVYKVNRAARNLFDFVEIERLESEYDVPFICVSQPTEAELDRQVLAIFAKMRINDEDVRDWFRMVLASQTKDSQAESRAQRAELTRQEALLVAQQDRLLDMRLREVIDQDSYAAKQTQLRDRLASIKLQRDAVDRSHDETADFLNFRKPLRRNGLRLIASKNVESSKSCF